MAQGWTKHPGDDNQSIGFGIVSDNLNDILYLTGLFTGTIDVNPDNGSDPGTDSETINGGNSMFIWKYQN